MYNNINRVLLRKYKKHLIDKRTDLQVKSIGSYWTHYKWTEEDQKNWDNVSKKLNRINKVLR